MPWAGECQPFGLGSTAVFRPEEGEVFAGLHVFTVLRAGGALLSFGLKGRDSPAQGIALGTETAHRRSPERAEETASQRSKNQRIVHRAGLSKLRHGSPFLGWRSGAALPSSFPPSPASVFLSARPGLARRWASSVATR